MKKTKPYWYYDTAYSIEPYFVCINFPNLLKDFKKGKINYSQYGESFGYFSPHCVLIHKK